MSLKNYPKLLASLSYEQRMILAEEQKKELEQIRANLAKKDDPLKRYHQRRALICTVISVLATLCGLYAIARNIYHFV